MCGIAGFLNPEHRDPPRESLVRRMLGMIRHRGPDQFGIYLDDQAALGSARLSIVDIAGGQQPISTPDGRFRIVFNGEIFNHRELRRRLEAEGVEFRTRTDTEVLLAMWVRHGESCLQELNGQFAFAILDSLQRELILARDRLGVRPLFYTRAGGAFVFASEIKSIAVHPDVTLSFDAASLGQVFTGWSCQAPRTPFAGIHQLPPGHTARVDRHGEIRISRYWHPDFSGAGGSDPLPDSVQLDTLRELLGDATRLRLQADVPVGAYLSGGLDSSVIAALARRSATGRFDTFSIAFADAGFDESVHQERMARHLGTEHQTIRVTSREIGELFPEVVWHAETPLLRTAPAPMFLLSRLVHQSGYRVVLTGEGADEFLGGYDIFKEAAIRAFCARQPESAARKRLFQRIYPDLQRLAGLGPAYLAKFFGESLADSGAPDSSHEVRWRNTRRTHRFLSSEMQEAIRNASAPMLDPAMLPDRFGEWGVPERAQYVEIVTFLSPYLLSSQGDRPAMANSVEGRYPFLDHRVTEFCMGLPSRLKLRGLRDKVLLRRLGRELLPDALSERPKKPYRAPVHRSFFGAGSPEYVRELLAADALREAGCFNPAAVAKLVEKLSSGGPAGESDEMAIAGILSTQLLHHQFVRSLRQSRPLGPDDDVLVCDCRSAAPSAGRTHRPLTPNLS